MDCGDGFDAVSALEHFAAGKSYDLFPKELNVDFQCHVGHVDGGGGGGGEKEGEEKERREEERGEGELSTLSIPSSSSLAYVVQSLFLNRMNGLRCSSAGPGPAGISSIELIP